MYNHPALHFLAKIPVKTVAAVNTLVGAGIMASQTFGTHLDISTKREVFPEWVALKAVVSEDPPQIRVVGEKYTIHVPNLNEKR